MENKRACFLDMVSQLDMPDLQFLLNYARELRRAERVFVFEPRKVGTGPLVIVGRPVPQTIT